MPPAATPAPRPHTSIRPALARSSSSSATPSPVERYYIRENVRGFPAVEPPWHDPIYDPRYTELYTGPQRSRIPVTLAWPLIDYDLRKYTSPQPPRLWFDTAFDPMVHPIKIIRSFGIAENMRAIEDAQLNVAENCYVGRMRIKCRYLSQWEIELKAPMGLRIIDVFAAIYKAYNQPLTREEKEAIGPEYLEKCKRSFLQRCEDSPGLTYHEERKGMMRIDLMRGRRLFKGLLPIHGMPDHYELIFDDKVIEQRRR
ncbi:hypothetical protein CPC08DRAFT_269897 [Agrocybe pediades]|nr:hypothetical protein CPC08DRAFT_269897 [Agrocybe pediades]